MASGRPAPKGTYLSPAYQDRFNEGARDARNVNHFYGGVHPFIQASSIELIDVSVTDQEFHDFVAVYVGTGGNICVDGGTFGTAQVLKNIPNGTFLPILVKKIYNNLTTASDIMVLHDGVKTIIV